jgi:hypothetical protein
MNELPHSILAIHAAGGDAALGELPGIGKGLAVRMSQSLRETGDSPSQPAGLG